MEKFKVTNRTQYGEEALIKNIVDRLSDNSQIKHNHYVVEFGAWDGNHLSNTRFLAKSGFPVIWIEPNQRRFKKLKKNIDLLNQDIERLPSYAVKSYVSELPGETLDEILSNYIDLSQTQLLLLSVDIDGSDLQAFCTLSKRYQPKIVVIEYNYFMNKDFVYLNPKFKNEGTSGRALVMSFNSMGYILCGQTLSNLIFVKSEFSKGIKEVDFQTAVYTHFSYGGELNIIYNPAFKRMHDWLDIFKGKSFVIWPLTWGVVHQPIPKFWRKWPRNQLSLSLYLNAKSTLFHPISSLKLFLRFIKMFLK